MSNTQDWLVLVVVLIVVLVAALALVIATVVLAFAHEFRAALLCSAVANCLLMIAVKVGP